MLQSCALLFQVWLTLQQNIVALYWGTTSGKLTIEKIYLHVFKQRGDAPSAGTCCGKCLFFISNFFLLISNFWNALQSIFILLIKRITLYNEVHLTKYTALNTRSTKNKLQRMYTKKPSSTKYMYIKNWSTCTSIQKYELQVH